MKARCTGTRAQKRVVKRWVEKHLPSKATTDTLNRGDRLARMRFDRSSRLLTSWIAVLALVMAALAPSVSGAISAGPGASWVEICTSIGAKWAQAEGASQDEAPASGTVHAFEHCPFCSLHLDALPIPDDSALLVSAPSVSDLLPTAFLAAPHTLHAWRTGQPRAPPSLS